MASEHHVYLDLTDLVTSLVWHGAVSGIQRVQIGIASHAIRTRQATSISLFEGRLVSLDDPLRRADGDCDVLTDLIREIYQSAYRRYLNAQRTPIGWLAYKTRRKLLKPWYIHAAMRALGRTFAKGDVLASIGAYWQLPYLLDIYRHVAQRGVIVVGLVYDIFAAAPVNVDKSLWPDVERHILTYLNLPASMISISEFTRGQMLALHQDGKIQLHSLDVPVIRLAHEFPGFERNDSHGRPRELDEAIGNDRFILIVGSGVHKNHPFIRQVWSELKRDGVELPHLVFAGRLGKSGLIEESGEIWIDCPDDRTLAGLYSACEFTFFPSLAEGWGLPVGESLWFGKLCVTSTATSLPEVGGDLCLYVDPHDPASAKDVIRRALDIDQRAAFERRIAAAELRTWADVAEEMTQTIASMRS